MQRTVGPCHRDRKQKRNEKREERKRDSTAGGEGGEEGGEAQGGPKGDPPGDTFVVGQSQQEGLRQQMLLSGVDCMKETGPLALGRGRKGDYAKATVTAQRSEGREEGKVPEQAPSGHRNIKKQEKRLCPPVLGTSVNAKESQALCRLELCGRAGVPSRKAEGMKAGAGLPFPAAPHPACG